MVRSRLRISSGLLIVCALTASAGLPACWVVVGGEDKVLVDADEARGGRTGKAPTQGGQAGALGGEGGSGSPGGGGGAGAGAGEGGAGSSAGTGASGGAGGAGVGGAAGSGAGGAAMAGTGGSTGGTNAGGGSGGANGGSSTGGAGAGTGGTAGASGGGAGGGAGKGGAAGALGGTGGVAGSGGIVQTGPGQFDCTVEPAKSSYPFCTNFSPAPGDWATFEGCNTRPVSGGNTTLLWSSAANSKCTAFLTANVPIAPTEATLSLWVRAKEIAIAASEPALDFARLDAGTHPGAAIGVRQVRNGLGVVTGNIVVLRSPALSGGSVDLGPLTLDKWTHMSVKVGFKGGKATVGGGYGATSADELATNTVDSAATAATASPLKVQVSFIQTEFLVGQTTVEIDDVYVH